MFSKKDVHQIKKNKISVREVEQQIQIFQNGFPYLEISKAAVINDGIIVLDEQTRIKYSELYEQKKNVNRIVKFVPASGAATRMFKNLFDLINSYKGTETEYLELIKDRSFSSIYYFLEHLVDFALYDDLVQAVQAKNLDFEQIAKNKDFITVLKMILFEEGLNYANLPKGLLKFHKYKNGNRTPVEEHIIEGINYGTQKGVVRIHFTVSPEHKNLFKAHVNEVKRKYEKEFGVKLDITFSEQLSSTNTIAVNADNTPFRELDGSLVFRPGGHGALLRNLDNIDADIVFIKNIDNVTQDRMKNDTYLYKKILAGILVEIQEIVFNYLKLLRKGKVTSLQIEEIEEFLEKKLYLAPPESFSNMDLIAKQKYLFDKLNRPIRVCGMVRNEGEPGGGPYWAKNPDGSISLQIVESSQFKPNNSEQQKIIASSTHFNPVDLVCGIRNYKGNRFNLLKFQDENTGFISKKSKDGKDLKALELPGLWNGAMGNWNTLFVEVPITTFNPVKTIHDLLRREHMHDSQLLASKAAPINIVL